MIPLIGARTPDTERHRGWGLPLEGTSWQDLPLGVGTFVGPLASIPGIPNRSDQSAGVIGGVYYGWDYDHYWGLEKRFSFADVQLTGSNGQGLTHNAFALLGEYRLLHYPLGDSRVRPYFTVALGLADLYYVNDQNRSVQQGLFLLPYGVGCKYMLSPRWAGRIELLDDLTFGGGGLAPLHNLSVTAGLEFRFDLDKSLLWPWRKK